MGEQKTKYDIINEIAKNKVVEDIIRNIAGTDDDLEDLSQDIYINLMEKNDELIQHLYSNKQMNFFITRMITNNVYSKNSPFYANYKKNNINKKNIEEYANKL